MKSKTKLRFSRLTLIVLGALTLGGCATFSNDGGFATVQRTAKERTGQEAKWIKSDAERQSVRERVQQLLTKPLSVDDAIQITLLNNRGLQAKYADLGIAEADRVQAGRLRNPGFSYARLSRSEGGETEIEHERAFMFDLLGLITMPVRTKIENRRFEQARLRAALDTLQTAADTRRAYFSAIAAQQTVTYLEDAKVAAEAGVDLAQRLVRAGNWSKLQQAREQAFYAEVTANLARARQTALAEREKLTRLMGLWGDDIRFQLPERLPDLPKSPHDLPDVERDAMRSRMDILMGQRELEGLASSFGLTKATRFVNVLEVGYLNNSETGAPRQTGYEIELEIPLFDWGGARVAKAEAMYLQAANRFAEIAINARSEVRETYSGYRTAYDLARHYRDEIVPLRKKIAEENVLRYNGMLISVFELLADARDQVAAVNSAIEALRDYWIADSALEMALTGGSEGGTTTAGASASVPTASEGGGH